MSRDYRPSPVRGVELRSKPLPGVNYQEIPATERQSDGATEGDLEATRVPSGPHKGKTLLQLLNDHPGYLRHLAEDAFTDDEEFELKVDEFVAKYAHRIERATGGSQASILWVASMSAQRKEAFCVHVDSAAATIEAIDHASAEALAMKQASELWPAHEHHKVQVVNISLAQLRRALKAESPGGAR